MVERQARSLGQMVERMLKMGRVERAELAVVADNDLVESVERIVDDHRALAEARMVSLELVAAPLNARTDGAVLRVVLGNLLENAIRFSPGAAVSRSSSPGTPRAGAWRCATTVPASPPRTCRSSFSATGAPTARVHGARATTASASPSRAATRATSAPPSRRSPS